MNKPMQKLSDRTVEVGRCIYCRTTTGRLTTEHPMPTKLNGDVALVGGTCDDCKTDIDRFEGKLLNWWKATRFRQHIGRRKIAGRKKFLYVKAKTHPDWRRIVPMRNMKLEMKEWKTTEVAYDQHPALILLPILKPPGFFRKLTPEESSKDFSNGVWCNQQRVRGDRRYSEIRYGAHYHPEHVGRLVAKILHGLAVAALGIDGFEPFLTEIIRGKDLSKLWYYVGGNQLLIPPVREKISTCIWAGDPAKLADDQPNYVFAQVRLFGNLGAPVYYALVGHIPKDAVTLTSNRLCRGKDKEQLYGSA